MNSNWSYSLETPNLGQIRRFLEPRDLEIWQMTLRNDWTPLQYYFKLCASVRKRTIWVKLEDFFSRVTLKFQWRMTLKNNRAPLLSNIKLCASFHHHMLIQTVTVRKRLCWILTSVTLTFDLWPRPFAWTLLWSLVIMIKFYDDTMMGT